MKQKQKPARAQSPALMPAVARGLLLSLAAGLALCLLGALIAYFTPDPAAITRPIGLAAAALAALTGGYCSTKIHRREALLCGLLTGGGMLAVMLPLSLLSAGLASGDPIGLAVGLHLAIPLLSTVGALLGVRKKQAATAKRRRRG